MTQTTLPDTAKLLLADRELELPLIVGTEGEKALDVRRLRADTGYVNVMGPTTSNSGNAGGVSYAGLLPEEHQTVGGIGQVDANDVVFARIDGWLEGNADGQLSFQARLSSDTSAVDGAVLDCFVDLERIV